MTLTEKHKKHADLKRPGFGQYGRHELAILGAPCGDIQRFADTFIQSVETSFSVVYVDADHASGDETPEAPFSGKSRFTDKIAYRQLDMRTDPNLYQRRILLDDHDIVLINGNHFPGKQQIAFIHDKKMDSLQRKLDRLTDLRLVVLTGDNSRPFDFLNDHIGPQTTILHERDADAIARWFSAWCEATVAPLYGLVLAGGRSTRLGHDKTIISYHGTPHREHLYEVLSSNCEDTYLSVRPDQHFSDKKAITDSIFGLGPFGGILSAFRHEPDAAWLVVASDLPFASEAISALLQQRNPSKLATAFHNPETGFPDPLMTIWEPRAYSVMLNFLAQGYSCPRKVLINSDVHEVEVGDPKWLHNVNTPDDLQAALARLK